MKLKKYSKYKNSGIDWIGEIPEDWEVKKMNGNIKFDIGFTPSTGNDLFYDGNEIWITIGDMKEEYITDSKSYLSELGVKGYKKVKKGSLLYSFKLSVGKVAFAGKDLYTNEAIASFKNNNNYDLKYLYYHFPDSLVNFGTENIYGAKMLNQELIKSSKVLFPPLQTQQNISSFLDTKTSQIEKLIEKDRNLIELLKEKRVSLINSAVTKGIEKNVKMKDSGVEWIGEIPKSWEVGPLKYYMNISGGYAFSSEDFSDDGIQLIRIGNLYLNNLDLNRQPIFLPNSFKKQHREFLIKKGDILLSLTGTLGKKDYGYAILVEGNEDYFLNQRVGRLNSKNNLLNYYAIYLLQSEFYLNQIYLLPSGSKQANLSNEQVLSPIVMIPSIQEQQEIVEFLDKETVKIDNHVKKVEKRIELYEEYKKSLIYNVVTGKVEV